MGSGEAPAMGTPAHLPAGRSSLANSLSASRQFPPLALPSRSWEPFPVGFGDLVEGGKRQAAGERQRCWSEVWKGE
jgi:hypothetical protein